jgi:hypothetical protein
MCAFVCVSGTFRPWSPAADRGTAHRPGCLPGSYKGLATFAPALFHNFFHSCGNLRGETLRSRSRNVAGRGLYHSNSTADNHALTPLPRVRYYLSFFVSSRSATEVSNSHGQGRTHISAESPAPEADPRVPRPDGDQEGPAGPRAPAREGAQAPRCDRFAVRTSCRRHEPPQCLPMLCHRRGVSAAAGSSSAFLTPAAELMAATSPSSPSHLQGPTAASASWPARSWGERS